MRESYQHHNQQQQASGPSRLGLKTSGGGGGGEIVEVQGGHIVRSTNRKDRHSKVCTAKGARDRRVRLSAHTAIQFYDVQDRLGYDRPSKAVDWLINKAKTAIDKLPELPAWKPTTTNPNPIANFEQNPDDDSIVDNPIPMGNFQNSNFYLPPSRNQDLRLSLQYSVQDPILQNQHPANNNNNIVYFDGSGWSDNQPAGGYAFSSQPTTPFLQPLFGQTTTNDELFSNNNSQREPLQIMVSPIDHRLHPPTLAIDSG